MLLGPTREGQNARVEMKGQDNQEQQTKREFLVEWVRAVNRHGEFARGAPMCREIPTTPFSHTVASWTLCLSCGPDQRTIRLGLSRFDVGDAAPTRRHHTRLEVRQWY